MPLVSMPRHTFIKHPPTVIPAGDVMLFGGGWARAAGSRARWAVMRPLLALIATLLLVAIVPTSASGSVPPGEPVADPQVDAWLGIAHARWGHAPDCPDGVLVDRAERMAGASVWASAETLGCRISLDPDFYPRPAAFAASAWGRRAWTEQMCNVVVHEWGHLLGHAHASDPHDLMAPVVPLVVPDCRPGAPASAAEFVQSAGKRKQAKRPPARAGRTRKAAARRAAARAAVSTTISPTTPSNE